SAGHMLMFMLHITIEVVWLTTNRPPLTLVGWVAMWPFDTSSPPDTSTDGSPITGAGSTVTVGNWSGGKTPLAWYGTAIGGAIPPMPSLTNGGGASATTCGMPPTSSALESSNATRVPPRRSSGSVEPRGSGFVSLATTTSR